MGGAGSGRWAGSGSCGRESEDVPGQQFLEIYFWTLVVVGFCFFFVFFFVRAIKGAKRFSMMLLAAACCGRIWRHL